MKKVLGTLAVAGLLTGAVSAAEVAVVSPIDVHGGFSAGYTDENNQGFFVSNFLVELSKAPTEGLGFTAAFGYLANQPATVSFIGKDSGGGDLETKASFGFEYGYLTVVPMEGLALDAGVLPTMVGYEVANTYANPNINIAAIWGAQPVYYPGARATYAVNDKTAVFAEVNQDGRGAWSVGTTATVGTVDVVASYYAYNHDRDILDIILSSSFQGLDIALNIDGHIASQADEKGGIGAAFYVTPKFGNILLPVRLEYMNGDIFADTKGWDIAITPTYAFGENGYGRLEVFYKDYDHHDGSMSYALEFGYTF